MKLNIHSYGVLHGLGWVAILADGWILHTSYFWLSAAGVWLLITSFLNMRKEVNMTTENGFNGTTADDLAKAAGTTYTMGRNKMPVGDLSIHDGEKYYKFVPKEDMTGQEAAWICMLFTTATISNRGIGINYYDYMDFVRKHGLERHFEEQAA
jgi:hypothetical protein